MELGSLLPQTHIPTLVISLVALAALIIVKVINSCYSHKLLLPVPIELMVVSTRCAMIFQMLDQETPSYTKRQMFSKQLWVYISRLLQGLLFLIILIWKLLMVWMWWEKFLVGKCVLHITYI